MENNIRQPGASIHPLSVIEEGALLGSGVVVDRCAHVARGAVIGECSTLAQCVEVEEGAVIGRGVTVRAGVVIAAGARIGDEVLLGEYAALLPELNSRAVSAPEVGAPITIGQGARIGDKSTIGPGVAIGAGAVIAPGSVVAADVPPHTLAAGNPSRIVGPLCRCAEPPTTSAVTCPACNGIRDIPSALESL